jgi:hypothetical protein
MGEIMDYIIKIAACLTALGVISTMVFKGIKSSNTELKSMITDLGNTIKQMDYNQCKRYLTDYLSDIENRILKTDIQRLQACEVYTHYTKDLKGNTWVTDKWEELHKKGLI